MMGLTGALCRTCGMLLVKKVFVIAWEGSFGGLGLGVSTQKIGVKVDFSMAGRGARKC